MNFKLQRYEERPATIQEHRELRDEIARLQESKRHFSALADAKGKENVALRAIIEQQADTIKRLEVIGMVARRLARGVEQRADDAGAQ